MKILVDTRPFAYVKADDATIRFIVKILGFLEKNKADLQILFLAERQSEFLLKYKDEINILTFRSFAGKQGWKIWHDWYIPRIIKKNKIDLFVSFCATSYSLKIPQIFWSIDDLRFDHLHRSKSYFLFCKNRIQATLKNANSIFVFSDISKQNLVQQHNREKEKIFVVKPAADEKYKPLLWTEKENTKIEFTGGKEYFSVTGINETKKIITVLKAFSIFKKKQQSNMHLVIIAENITGNSELFEKLENFKYRTDVHLHNSYPGEETVNIISSAYALVCSGNENALPVMVLNAFNAGIPVVVSKQDSLAELTGDAVLYTDITDQELLAADLNKLYKDEMLRSRLIEKGKNMSQKFNRQQSIEQVWNGILHATNNPQQNNYS